MEGRLILMAIICLLIAQLAFAAEDNYQFDSPELQQRFVNLSKQLRCATCQNQSLFESSANIALDLKAQIYRMINANLSDYDIKEYLSERYGDYILFNPPLHIKTIMLWFGPILMLLSASWMLYRRYV